MGVHGAYHLAITQLVVVSSGVAAYFLMSATPSLVLLTNSHKLSYFSQDWKCILSMLLDENPMIELTDEDATNLIRLLSASVKKAVGERIVPATDNRKQYYSKAQKVRMSSVLFAFSHTHTVVSLYAFLILSL